MVWSHLGILMVDLMKWANNQTVNSSGSFLLDSFEVSNNESQNEEEHAVLNDASISIPAVQAFISLMYFTIFVLGISGNILVCYVVFKNKNMQTVTNFFIANLAMSDILLCLFAVPLTPLYTFMGQWVFGAALCHIFTFAQGVSIYISTLTLTSIAVDRYIVIIYPFNPRMKVSTSIMIIICIWVVACIFTSPYAKYLNLMKQDGNYYCEENWPSDVVMQAFAFSTTFLQFVLPFIIIAYCYLMVFMSLSKRARSKPGAKSSRQEDADRERNRRTNRMLMAMVAIFGGSWLPLNLFNLVGDLHGPARNWYYRHLTFLLTHVIAMSSTCYNPFLYAWLNENFRKEFKMVLPFLCANNQGLKSTRNPATQNQGNHNYNGNASVNEMLINNSSCREKNLTAKYVIEEDRVQISATN